MDGSRTWPRRNAVQGPVRSISRRHCPLLAGRKTEPRFPGQTKKGRLKKGRPVVVQAISRVALSQDRGPFALARSGSGLWLWNRGPRRWAWSDRPSSGPQRLGRRRRKPEQLDPDLLSPSWEDVTRFFAPGRTEKARLAEMWTTAVLLAPRNKKNRNSSRRRAKLDIHLVPRLPLVDNILARPSGSEDDRLDHFDRGPSSLRHIGGDLHGTVRPRCWESGRRVLFHDFLGITLPPVADQNFRRLPCRWRNYERSYVSIARARTSPS